jgi:glutamyl-tRNA synthetase
MNRKTSTRPSRMRDRVRGRFAPSPTGEMHVGNASSALLAWLSVRAQSGVMVLRMEDLDLSRVCPGSAASILEDLHWLGLDWDEGPDDGPHVPYWQSSRFDLYESAFRQLQDAGRVYPCFCSRKEVASAASAPQNPNDERRYPGTCRELAASAAERRITAGERHSWRFRVEQDHGPVFRDLVYGPQGGSDQLPPGDFVVRRFDGSAAYHLAVVVDDLAMDINEVVRGDDLLPSAARQILLAEALGGRPPVYGHVPLILGSDGIRLAKRHKSVTLRELREAGWSPDRLVGELAFITGLRPTREPVPARKLVDRFSLQNVSAAPEGRVWGQTPD